MTSNGVPVVKGFYDIVILPPPPIRDHAIELSAMLAGLGSKVRLSEDAFKPHLSLYHIPVADDDVPSFLKALRKTVRGRKKEELDLDGIDLRAIHRAFFLNVFKPQWLDDLAMEVIGATLPYYDETNDVRPLWGDLTPEMEANFVRYGTPMAERFFVPHFTFAVLPDDDAMVKGVQLLQERYDKRVHSPITVSRSEDLRILPKTIENGVFAVDRVSVARIGPNLSCQDIIEEIPFWS